MKQRVYVLGIKETQVKNGKATQITQSWESTSNSHYTETA
jgi:hypothetical protein